jgi:hypothetical protein
MLRGRDGTRKQAQRDIIIDVLRYDFVLFCFLNLIPFLGTIYYDHCDDAPTMHPTRPHDDDDIAGRMIGHEETLASSRDVIRPLLGYGISDNLK